MTGLQRVAIAVAMVAAGSIAACSNDDASPESTAPASASTARPVETKPPSSTVATTATPTTTSMTSSTTSSTTASSGSGTSSQQTVVRTDGGSIEVRGNGNVLEVVDITTADGWEVEVDRPDERQLVAVFTGPGGRSEVTIVLTDQGIQTSTRATS